MTARERAHAAEVVRALEALDAFVDEAFEDVHAAGRFLATEEEGTEWALTIADQLTEMSEAVGELLATAQGQLGDIEAST